MISSETLLNNTTNTYSLDKTNQSSFMDVSVVRRRERIIPK